MNKTTLFQKFVKQLNIVDLKKVTIETSSVFLLFNIIFIFAFETCAPNYAQGLNNSEETINLSSMVLIKAGDFHMGSNVEEDKNPLHVVYIDSFNIDLYEVTQLEFEQVMGQHRSNFRGDNFPVLRVTWKEAQKYCEKKGKRLPTDAEWEKAARGGTESKYYWGDQIDDSYAWYGNNSNETVHPVGQKKPNAFGLFDMLGNVYEWVSDWHDSGVYKSHPRRNPKGPPSGHRKVIRGGSWYYSPDGISSANRDSAMPDDRNIGAGFRCAKDAN